MKFNLRSVDNPFLKNVKPLVFFYFLNLCHLNQCETVLKALNLLHFYKKSSQIIDTLIFLSVSQVFYASSVPYCCVFMYIILKSMWKLQLLLRELDC